jgi:hypothetical protein
MSREGEGMAAQTLKPFPFTAADMREQLRYKMVIDDFDCWDGKKGMKVEGRIGVVCGLPDQCVLIPVDEWKELIAWVAKHERAMSRSEAREDDHER